MEKLSNALMVTKVQTYTHDSSGARKHLHSDALPDTTSDSYRW